jgi:hypothetical protein
MTISPNDSPCKGLFGKLFGHTMQPRDSVVVVYPAQLESMVRDTSEPWKAEVADSLKGENVTHHYDICTRCGLQVKP